MKNFAIIIGNSEYQHSPNLDCCLDDALAISKLLTAAEKYDSIEILKNKNAADLKDAIRTLLTDTNPIQELFVYFSGHGYLRDGEFFLNATDFDVRRPNETGLSQTELHTLLRATNAELVVKVIDACSSGTLLLKSDENFLPIPKEGFNNVIQIASCLNSQSSLTGNPLSTFTQSFYDAALTKENGAVYYSDIISSLRDSFLDNEIQTPHFVSQGTGREIFVKDATKFSPLREERRHQINSEAGEDDDSDNNAHSALTPLEQIARLDQRFAKKDTAEQFIGTFFDRIVAAVRLDTAFADFYEITYVEHNDFNEDAAESFITRVLHNEKRQDKLVTATVSREPPANALRHLGLGLGNSFMTSPEWTTTYYLHLNCHMERVQLKILLVPKFRSLKQFSVIVSCAPSVEICYVFFIISIHSLDDWDTYESTGRELDRKWYKRNWTDSTDKLVEQFQVLIHDAIDEHIQAVISQAEGHTSE